MFTARFALSVANLERLAELVRAIPETGCEARLAIGGDIAELTVDGEPEALNHAAALMRSTMDSAQGPPG